MQPLQEHAGSAAAPPSAQGLNKTLGPVMLWGLGVGYVISGEYFGWNLGLPVAGSYGMLAALVIVTIMYVAFVLSYAELACAIPRAGGVFVYGVRALGLRWGYLGGIAQLVEFVFAPPAIAMAIGEYGNIWIAGIDQRLVALAAYAAFTLLNIWGVRQAALFELGVTILAVIELAVFLGAVGPSFRWEHFSANPLPHGPAGMLAAIPFAIWFYLAIEGVANAAEEARNPQRDVLLGFGSALATLVVLALGVFVASVGVGGWERIVYRPEDLSIGPDGAILVAPGAATTDKPLPLALAQLSWISPAHVFYHLLVGIGLLGLIASFHGIILAASRALFEMGRVGFLPELIGTTHTRTRTPVAALLANLVVGMASILLLDTGQLITISALGAVTLYVVAMIALVRLRSAEPELPRPYRAPLYPVLPLVALGLAGLSLGTMLYLNLALDPQQPLSGSPTLWYLGLLAAAGAYFQLVVRGRLTNRDLAHFYRVD